MAIESTKSCFYVVDKGKADTEIVKIFNQFAAEVATTYMVRTDF